MPVCAAITVGAGPRSRTSAHTCTMTIPIATRPIETAMALKIVASPGVDSLKCDGRPRQVCIVIKAHSLMLKTPMSTAVSHPTNAPATHGALHPAEGEGGHPEGQPEQDRLAPRHRTGPSSAVDEPHDNVGQAGRDQQRAHDIERALVRVLRRSVGRGSAQAGECGRRQRGQRRLGGWWRVRRGASCRPRSPSAAPASSSPAVIPTSPLRVITSVTG